MNKKEFVTKMAEKGGMSKKDSEKVVNLFLDLIQESLERGEEVKFIGFGGWTVRTREARKAKSPLDGKVIDIPKKRVVRFKPGKQLSEKINKK